MAWLGPCSKKAITGPNIITGLIYYMPSPFIEIKLILISRTKSILQPVYLVGQQPSSPNIKKVIYLVTMPPIHFFQPTQLSPYIFNPHISIHIHL